MASGGSTKTVLTALFANGGIAIAKFVGFLVTRSSSMLTESVHSLADTSNQALLLLGGRQAKKAESREHPFGYGRERYFWSFVVALILFSLGGLFAIYEGWEKIHHPHELDSPVVALVILILAMILEGFAFNTARKEAEHVKGKLSWTRFIRRSRNPELPVVLLEDAGAMLGLVIAFFGVLASTFIDPVYDGWATLAIGILLLCIAVVLAIEMKSLIIGESAVPEDRDRLIAAIEGHRDVTSLIHMRTQHIGPDEILVGAKVHFRDTLDAPGLITAINETETEMRTAVPIARVIYLEPDLVGAPSVTMGTLPYSPDLDAGASHDDDDHGDDDHEAHDDPEDNDGEPDDEFAAFAGAAAASTQPPPPKPADLDDADLDDPDLDDADLDDADLDDADLDDPDLDDADLDDAENSDDSDDDADSDDDDESDDDVAWSDAIGDNADDEWAASAGLDDTSLKDTSLKDTSLKDTAPGKPASGKTASGKTAPGKATSDPDPDGGGTSKSD